jgi:hypothetical protein
MDANARTGGFRVFKLAESNFKAWEGQNEGKDINELERQLELHVDHIRKDRTGDDILSELHLKSGFFPFFLQRS